MKNNSIKYNHSIVSFFDILGFRNIVEDNSAETIYKILEIFKNQSKHDEELASLFEMKFTNFSDCVVRSVDFIGNEAEYPIEIFFSELIDLVHIQCSLIYENILIRGAISIDEIFHNNNVIFGPGLIESYTLENKCAKYPRIVITKNLIDTIFEVFGEISSKRDLQSDINYIMSLLRGENENLYFIDYLKVINNEVDDHTDYVNFLSHHKNLIINNYSSETKSKIKEKYIWLAEYHNDVVHFMRKGLQSFGYDVDKLSISKSIIPNKGLLYKVNET